VHDLASESIIDREARTAAVDYARQARNLREWSLDRFEQEYLSELADVVDFLPVKGSEADRIRMVWELLHRHGEHVGTGVRNMIGGRADPLQPFAPSSFLALVSGGEHLKPEVRRLADSIQGVVRAAIGEMFAVHRPRNERDLNRKIAALLRTHETKLKSEHPTKSFACASVVPDHILEAMDLLVEAKYLRGRTSPSKATEGIAADLTKYPESGFILFIVYDPDHAIASDEEFRQDIESKGRNSMLILR
jgi:hypothetical protein